MKFRKSTLTRFQLSPATKSQPYATHYPQGPHLLARRISPSMTPKQRRRAGVLFRAYSLYSVTRYRVYTLLLLSRNTGIVADNTNLARTYTGTHDIVASVTFPCLSLFFLWAPRTCVFGSAGRDGWARRSFGQGVVLGLPRDLRREIDALWEAIAAQPMHRQW